MIALTRAASNWPFTFTSRSWSRRTLRPVQHGARHSRVHVEETAGLATPRGSSPESLAPPKGGSQPARWGVDPGMVLRGTCGVTRVLDICTQFSSPDLFLALRGVWTVAFHHHVLQNTMWRLNNSITPLSSPDHKVAIEQFHCTIKFFRTYRPVYSCGYWTSALSFPALTSVKTCVAFEQLRYHTKFYGIHSGAWKTEMFKVYC